MSDNETTVTLLIAIASPAHSGFIVMPKNGYSTPEATGISAEL
jgi:hypothetical protein